MTKEPVRGSGLWQLAEKADLTALEETWSDGTLGRVLGHALNSFNRLGHVKAETAAERLGVSESTIRRWVRSGIPRSRLVDVVALVRPPEGAFEQERADLNYARGAVRTIRHERAAARSIWGGQGWLSPHYLAIVRLRGTDILVARIAGVSRDARAMKRLAAGGTSVESAVFANRFAAQVARGEILEDVYNWRVRLPDTKISRGSTKAWLAEAPRKELVAYRRHPRRVLRRATGR